MITYDCTNNSITIVKQELTDAILDVGQVGYTINLDLQHNCCINYPTISDIIAGGEAPEYDVIIDGSNVSLVLTTVYLGDLPDGIYTITISILETGQSEAVTTTYCLFVDCETKCKVAAHIEGLLESKDDSIEAFLYHYALEIGDECECDCTELCELYNRLLAIINDKPCQSC